jgi:hypothetical protein
MSWILAYDAVDAHRKNGLDPNGHPPGIPHLCERDVTKVCNCCQSCKTVCWTEKFDGTTERLRQQFKQTARGVVTKLLRLVRK